MLRKWIRETYEIDLEQALGALRNVNASTTMVASDRLLHQHFPTLRESLHPTAMDERVVLLDGLWGTRLYAEAAAADCISRNLCKHAEQLLTLFESMDSETLEGTPERVIDAATKALPVILSAESNAGPLRRQNYSFATKFFHWTTRFLFPIVDSRARAQISRIQRDHHIRRTLRVPSAANKFELADDYRRWICFYSDILQGLNIRQREQFVREDYDSQPKRGRITNSLLRILDKVFYRQGGGSGQGRFEK